MDIRPINLDDDAEILACWDLLLADRRTADPDFSPEPEATRVSLFRTGFGGHVDRRWVAVEDGRLVGHVCVNEVDATPDEAHLQVTVARDHRGRGLGSRLLVLGETETLRPVFTGAYSIGPGSNMGGCAERFAARHGYREHTRDIERALPWPPPPAATQDVPTPGYVVRAYVGALPEELVNAYNRLVPMVQADAPNGELPGVEAVPNPSLYSGRMARMGERGLTRVFAVAVQEGTGEVAALSDLSFHAGEGTRGWGSPSWTGRTGGTVSGWRARRRCIEPWSTRVRACVPS